MNTLELEVIRTLVKKLLTENHFSICTVDELLRLTGGVPPAREYQILRALHCVNYRDMTPPLRLALPRLLQVVLESQPIHYDYTPPTLNQTNQRQLT